MAVRFGGITILGNASKRSAYTSRELHAEVRKLSKGKGLPTHYWVEITANGNPRLVVCVVPVDGADELQLRAIL